jgi:GPH family glycoside/pentoside/hexuronide:cation symporter
MALGDDGRVGRLRVAAYGSGEVGQRAIDIVLRLHLLVLATEVYGFDPLLAGILIATSIIWDAITDPLIGWWSDRLRQRRQLLSAGAALCALSCALLALAPGMTGDHGLRVVAFLVGLLALETGGTLVGVPSLAIGADLSPHERQRTRLYAARLGWGNLGLLIGLGLTAALLANSPSQQSAYCWTLLLLGALVLIATGGTWWSAQGSERKQRPQTGNLAKEIGTALGNKELLILLGAGAISTFGLGLNGALALYFYRYRLQLEEAHTQGILLLFILVWTCSLPLWVWAAKRVPGRALLAASIMALGLAIAVTYPFMPAGGTTAPLIMAVVGGFLLGAVLLLEVLIAQAAKAGPGIGFGLWNLMTKICRALSVAAAGWALASTGYRADETVPDDLGPFLAIAFGPGVGLFFVLGGILLLAGQVHTRQTVVSS